MDKYFWRQFVVLLSILLQVICDGISMALPGVMTAAMTSPNTTDVRVTPSEASWIAAAPGLGAFPGVFLASFLVECIGRKYTRASLVFIDLISWIALTFANDFTSIFIVRFMRGFGEAFFTDGIMISEYINPERRGYFSTIKKLSLAIGGLICHTMSLYCSWRQVTACAAVALLISFILVLTWKESPAYCAMKGKFKECEANFLWLHGDSKERREELEHLMAAQMLRLEKEKTQNKIRRLFRTFLDKSFLKALYISILLTMIIDLCGRYYYFAYIKQIFMLITNSESFSNYCSVGNDLITVVGLTLSCFIVKYFNRRTLVFRFGLLTAFLMFAVSLSDFLKVKHHMGLQHQWITPSLLLLLNFIVNLGVVPINFTVAIELFSLEHRGLGFLFANLIVFVFLTVSMKFTGQMLNVMGLYGTYGTFAVGILLCLLGLYFVLPETKNKTMQDIEDELKNEDTTVVRTRVKILKEKLQDHKNVNEFNALLLKKAEA